MRLQYRDQIFAYVVRVYISILWFGMLPVRAGFICTTELSIFRIYQNEKFFEAISIEFCLGKFSAQEFFDTDAQLGLR